MLHDDRLSPEEARGTFLITTLCGEATGTWHGATSHLETAAACLATCASAVTDLPVPPQLSAQSSCTTCLLPWWDEHSCRRVLVSTPLSSQPELTHSINIYYVSVVGKIEV